MRELEMWEPWRLSTDSYPLLYTKDIHDYLVGRPERVKVAIDFYLKRYVRGSRRLELAERNYELFFHLIGVYEKKTKSEVMAAFNISHQRVRQITSALCRVFYKYLRKEIGSL